MIADKINEQTNALNILQINQENLLHITQNISLHMNQLITDHNCLKLTLDQELDLLNTWSNIVPNSFIRALNGFLTGDLNTDIIPGDQPQQIIQLYPAFGGTIFENIPMLLYQSSKTKLISVFKDPLLSEGLITVPRILKEPFGKRFIQKSCTWKDPSGYHTLKQDHEIIKDHIKGGWWDVSACVYQDGVTLCDARQMSFSSNPCVGNTNNVTIRDCKTRRQTSDIPDNIIQTPNSWVVCTPETNVTIFKADIMGIIHTSVKTVSHPQLFTSQEADSLLVNYRHYPLSNAGPLINISSIYHYHPNPGESSELDHIHNIYGNKSMTPIQSLQIHFSFHISFYVLTILAITSIIIIGYLIYRKLQHSDWIT